jgi:hypothetical protein
MGLGFGDFMLGNFRTVPSPTDFLNQQAITAAARGMQGPTQHRAYRPGSNSFQSRSRDPGFVSTGEPSRRRFPNTGSSTSTRASVRETTRTESKPGAETKRPSSVSTVPTPPLDSFFDPSLKLVWPMNSPIDGDLGQKRDISDQASLSVLQETRQSQFASLATVTDARQKLLDYGRPALKELRTTSTTPVAESFHQFLLSLYESLAQASAAH